MIDLVVLTVTIPERAQMLAELAAAMDDQTVRPEWMIRVDEAGDGPVRYLNEMAEAADAEWLHRIDDDDLIDPTHFETLGAHLGDDYDIIYTWPRIDPPTEDLTEDGLQVVMPLASLRDQNFIASACAIRRSWWLELGGLRDVDEEDADLLVRAYNAGARFRCIPKVTWTYRMGDWPHRSDPKEGDG